MRWKTLEVEGGRERYSPDGRVQQWRFDGTFGNGDDPGSEPRTVSLMFNNQSRRPDRGAYKGKNDGESNIYIDIVQNKSTFLFPLFMHTDQASIA